MTADEPTTQTLLVGLRAQDAADGDVALHALIDPVRPEGHRAT